MKARAPSPAGSWMRSSAVSTRAAAVTAPLSRSRAKARNGLNIGSASHHVLHRFGKLLKREGFGQESEILLALEIFLEGVLSIARNEDDLGCNPALAQFLEQRRPIHFRHDNVGNHQADLIALLREGSERGIARVCFEHCITARGKRTRSEGAHRILVLDEKHGALAGMVGALERRALALDFLRCRSLLNMARQIDAEY